MGISRTMGEACYLQTSGIKETRWRGYNSNTVHVVQSCLLLFNSAHDDTWSFFPIWSSLCTHCCWIFTAEYVGRIFLLFCRKILELKRQRYCEQYERKARKLGGGMKWKCRFHYSWQLSSPDADLVCVWKNIVCKIPDITHIALILYVNDCIPMVDQWSVVWYG